MTRIGSLREKMPPRISPKIIGCQVRSEGRLDCMDLKLELILGLRALLALLIGGFMGWDRRHVRPTAGVRTYAAVCVGACVFGSLSLNMPEGTEKARIAAQVVSGIGFLGAGVIVRHRGQIAGL